MLYACWPPSLFWATGSADTCLNPTSDKTWLPRRRMRKGWGAGTSNWPLFAIFRRHSLRVDYWLCIAYLSSFLQLFTVDLWTQSNNALWINRIRKSFIGSFGRRSDNPHPSPTTPSKTQHHPPLNPQKPKSPIQPKKENIINFSLQIKSSTVTAEQGHTLSPYHGSNLTLWRQLRTANLTGEDSRRTRRRQ